MKSPTSGQLRNALQVGFAGFLAAGIYELVGSDVNSIDGFYLVYGAARSLLPTPEASWAAAQARVVGTVFGGVVVTLLMLVLDNWLAVGVGYVLIQLLGWRLGLSAAALMNASVIAVMLLAVPVYRQEGGWYVLYRTLWHLIGLAIGMLVERLFWYRSALERLQQSEGDLIHSLNQCCNGGHGRSAEQLIEQYARHCQMRQIALAHREQNHLQRDQLIEQALCHAVAMQRVPEGLRLIDQEACLAALMELQALDCS
jgi:uncharacterized membrane protein YgaE (UPF0421/DUF939 family)